MEIRDALIQQNPSLALQRAAADEIARLDALVARLEGSVFAERERCAKLVEVPPEFQAWEIHGGQETIEVLRDVAARIRAA